jgi:hypothetical protein
MFAAILSASCIGGWSEDEVARIACPSGGIDAVLTESNGGATTSFGYHIYLVATGRSYKKGTKVASLYGATRNESAYGVNLKWSGPEELVIWYLKARNTNVPHDQATVDGHQVRVVLFGGINDSNAPPGGMVYNLQKKK